MIIHGYTKKNRKAMRIFQKHLNQPGTSQERGVDFLTEEELQNFNRTISYFIG